jgi:hypothetical protein
MRIDAAVSSAIAILLLATTALAAEGSDPPPAPAVESPDRPFTALLDLEASVIGLSFGPRAELLRRLGAPGSVSHLRTTLGVLSGPEFVFVPMGLGYRAVFREGKTVQPLVGLGYEAHFFVTKGPIFVQWAAVYLEAGSGFAITDRLSVGTAVSVDWSFAVEGGPGLQTRLFSGLRF